MKNDDNFDRIFGIWMVVSGIIGLATSAALIYLLVQVAQWIGAQA